MTVSEELQLEIDAALGQVDRIGSELERAAELFKVALSDAIGVLAGVEVTADASEVTTEIEGAVTSADSTVEVEADTATAEEQVAGVTDTTGVVDVDADTSEAESEIAELDGATVTVGVDADTSGAQGDIDSLGRSASDAASSVDGLGGSMAGFGAAAGLAGGSADELVAGLGGLGAGGAVAAAGITAVATAATILFTSAVNAEGTTQAFERSLGSLGDEIRDVPIGDLNIDLAQLAQNLGSDDERVLQVTQQIAQMGRSIGQTDEETVAFTQSIILLAANARSVNPALGELGDIQAGLTRALARGGRFLTQYGVDLTATEIRARAAEQTGKALNEQFSQTELAAAGASLALEQLGPSIEENVENASTNAIIGVDRLKQVFGDTLEELGKPLIVPVLDLLESAIPPATSIVGLLGDVAGAAIPLLTGLLGGLGPVIEAVGRGLTPALASLQPAMERLGVLLGEALIGLVPLGGAIGEIVGLLADGLVVVLDLVNGALGALEPVLPGIAFGLATVGAAMLALNANPVVLLGTAIIALIGAVSDLKDETADFTQAQSEVDRSAGAFSSSVLRNASDLAGLREALGGSNLAFGLFIAQTSAFSKVDVGGRLSRIGQDMDTLRGQLEAGDAGLAQFIKRAEETGQLKIDIDADGALDAYDDLTEAQKQQVRTTDPLIQAFITEARAIEEASAAKLNELVLSGQVDRALVNEVRARREANGESGRAAEILREIVAIAPEVSAAQQSIILPLDQQAAAWVSLADAVARGEVNTSNFGTATAGLAEKLGVSQEQIGQFVTIIEQDVARIAEAAVSNLPGAVDAFNQLEGATDPQTVIDNLNRQTLAIALFQQNLKLLLDEGRTDTVEFLTQLPLEQASALAQSLLKSEPEVRDAFEGALETGEVALDNFETFMRTDAAPKIATATGDLAQRATNELGLNLDLSGAAKQPVRALATFLVTDDTAPDAADLSGKRIGTDLASGIGQGLVSQVPALVNTIVNLINALETAARRAAESNSPSEVFARIGEDLTAGLAIGMANDADRVVAEAEQIVRDAYAAAQVAALDAPSVAAPDVTAGLVPAGAPAVDSGLLVIQSLTVEVTAAPGVTAAEARQQGEAVADGVVSRLAAVDIAALVKGS